MGERLRRFMAGRYGQDHLGRFLYIVALIFLVLSIFLSRLFLILAIFVMVYAYFRMFSKNIQKRAAENMVYFAFRNKIKNWFSLQKTHAKQRKTHRFYKCPECGQKLRVPKGLGKITVTCTKCKHKFQKKT